MQRIFLVCGVPGSGKTWVCEQLEDRLVYVPHDDYPTHLYPVELFKMAKQSLVPILADCPFAERKLRDELVDRDLKVTPVFIVEHPDVVRRRYEEREHREIPKSHLTRASSIQERAVQWNAYWGTAQEVLKHLQSLT